MKIVSVTACPTGVAYTYMAQAAIEKECKSRDIEVKVETQGSMGIENELSQEEVNSADLVILAVAIEVEQKERFDRKEEEGKILYVEPGKVIKNPKEVIDKAISLL